MEHSPATLMVAALNGRDDGPCILLDDRGLSYRTVRDRVSQYLQALSGLGVTARRRVGLLSNNRSELIPIMAALTVLATTRVALNARGSLDDHVFMLGDAGVEMLVYDPVDFGAHVAEIARRMPALTLVPMRGDAPDPASATSRTGSNPDR